MSPNPRRLPCLPPPRPWSRPRRTCQGLGAHIAGPGHFPQPEPGPLKLSPPRAPQPAPPAPGNASRCRPLKLTVLPRVRRRASGVRMRDSCSRRDLRRMPLGIPRLRSTAWCTSISFRDVINVDPSQSACLAEIGSNRFCLHSTFGTQWTLSKCWMKGPVHFVWQVYCVAGVVLGPLGGKKTHFV